MIIFSDVVIKSVSFAVDICINNLFPSMLPFLILSSILSNYGFVEMDVAGAAKALQSVITMDNVRLLVRISDGEPSERSKRIEMRKQRQKFYESKRQMTRKINRLRYNRSDQYKKADNSDDNEGSSSPSEDKE